MARDSFLARVRQAAEMGRAYRVHLQPVPDDIGYIGVTEDLVERFAKEVNEVGGQAFVVADAVAARHTLHQLLAEAGAASAIVWQHELLARLGVRDWLAQPGIAIYDHARLATLPADQQLAELLACDIGITSCDCAIAETGTLMLCSQPGQERVASLLPPYYVTIVERAQIVPDLIDAFRLLSNGVHSSQFKVQGSPTLNPAPGNLSSALPSNVTFITGPSKTGDIELQLTTGVHGPGKWRVIVIG